MAATDPRNERLRKQIMAAVAALLGTAPAAQGASKTVLPETTPDKDPAPPSQWTWDTSFMQYNEADRISVSEPQIGVRRDYADQRAWTILATVDTISGSTPLGTLPLTQATAPNTVTSPSGHAGNPEIGKIPLSQMSDTRLGLNSTYERPVGNDSRDTWGASVGKEHDFLSLGGSFTRDVNFNQKNTTLAFGVSPEFDNVKPNGGLPFGYATAQAPGEFEGTSKNKYLISGLVGVTQIINPKTLMQFNYSPTYENGYLSDPYKLISVTNTNGDPLSAIHEMRPGYRLGNSFYWLTRYNIRALDVFGLSLRYYTDSWGIHSQTIDFTYRWQALKQGWLEPHVRYYHQSAADFFHVGLLNTQPLPDFASADYRLSAINGVTIGARVGWMFQNGSELILRAEYYTQTGDDRPSDAVGQQRYFDLFPTLNASIIQVDYHFQPSRLFSKKENQEYHR